VHIIMYMDDKMPSKTLDEKTETEFQFCFRQLNFFALHRLYKALVEVDGEIILVNDQGIRWTPVDKERKLREHFSQPNIPYKATIKGTEKELQLYVNIFDKYSDYLQYSQLNLQED